MSNPVHWSVVCSFKSAVTKEINASCDAPGARLWQRGYWEHIIRHERALERIREYIRTNPQRWELDRENPQCRGGNNSVSSTNTSRGVRREDGT